MRIAVLTTVLPSTRRTGGEVATQTVIDAMDAETFLIRRGSATFTIGSDVLEGHAGQILVVPARTPHKFSTGPDGYEAVHIHANPRFVTEWLE